MGRGIPVPSHLCGHDGKGYPLRVASAWNKTRRRGFPLLVASVWKETRREGVNPLSSCLYVKETQRVRVYPSHRVCVKGDTAGRGKTPSHRVCVERNTAGRGIPLSSRLCKKKHNGRGFPPLVASVWKETQHRRGFPPLVTSVWKQQRSPPPSRPFKVISAEKTNPKTADVPSPLILCHPSTFVPPCMVSLFRVVVPYRVVDSGVWWVGASKTESGLVIPWTNNAQR
jgi:hypothetical protein